MGIARQPPGPDFLAEPIEVGLGEAPFQEGSGVDPGRGMALEVDVIAGQAVLLAPEEMVEPDLVEGGGGGEARQMATDAVVSSTE